MRTVFVTGGTGLIGSNICKQLIERGDHVRALARPGSEMGPLRELGVTVVDGDITDAASVTRAAEGCDGVIHSAAVLGGPSQDMGEHQRVNTGGVANVLDAAQAAGITTVVTLGTTTYFDFKTSPLTETSPFDPHASGDPYTVTKGAAFLEAMRRADAGLDVSVVIPGGTYGPAPTINRAMEAPSFNLRIVWALLGKLRRRGVVSRSRGRWRPTSRTRRLPRSTGDVRGEKYLAFAGSHEVSTMAASATVRARSPVCPTGCTRSLPPNSTTAKTCGAGSGPSLTALAHQTLSPSRTSSTRRPSSASTTTPAPRRLTARDRRMALSPRPRHMKTERDTRSSTDRSLREDLGISHPDHRHGRARRRAVPSDGALLARSIGPSRCSRATSSVSTRCSTPAARRRRCPSGSALGCRSAAGGRNTPRSPPSAPSRCSRGCSTNRWRPSGSTTRCCIRPTR